MPTIFPSSYARMTMSGVKADSRRKMRDVDERLAVGKVTWSLEHGLAVQSLLTANGSFVQTSNEAR